MNSIFKEGPALNFQNLQCQETCSNTFSSSAGACQALKVKILSFDQFRKLLDLNMPKNGFPQFFKDFYQTSLKYNARDLFNDQSYFFR